MPVLKKIKENLTSVSYIETIARSYQEIAKIRMNQIRKSVLKNRELIEELLKLYGIIKSTHPVKVKKEQKKERVLVFLSSNERFYGDLILNIWKKVQEYFTKKEWELAIIGKTGKYLAEASGFGLKFYYFELDDEKPKIEKIEKIFNFVKTYKEILIFHGKFSTVLNQEVAITDIAGKKIEKEKLKEKKQYLFEPSPEEVLKFFEQELMFAFLNQALWEHQLSRYTTRMVAMFHAEQSTKKIKGKLKTEEEKIKRQIYNKKQIEQFSGYPLWTQKRET